MKVLFVLLGIMVMNTLSAKAITPSNSVSLLPGAELLFKEINTTISDDDKNSIFLQTGIYYDPVKKNLTPGKGIGNNGFLLEVFPTDMNGDGKEEMFIGETIRTNAIQEHFFQVYLPKNGKYFFAGKIEIPATAYYLFVYKTMNSGYNDIGFNTPPKIYRFNGIDYKESALKPGDYINVISDYSQNYTSPIKSTKTTSVITDYVFRNIKSKLTEEEKKFFTKDVVLQIRNGVDTSLKYNYEGAGATDELPVASMDIFPLDLNKDGVEEVFMRLNSSYFGQWLAPLNLFIKNKNGQFLQQEGMNEPRLFLRSTGNGGFPDLIGAAPEGPGFYKIPTKFNVYRWNGQSYQLFKRDQPYLKSDLSIEEKIGPAYQAGLPNSLLSKNIVVQTETNPATKTTQEQATSINKEVSSKTVEVTPVAAALFSGANTKLSVDQKNEIAYLSGIKLEEINAKTKNGKPKYGFEIYPLDLNQNGTEEIFICITTKTLGIPMHTYSFYTLNNLGHYQPSPGVIGQGVKIILNRVGDFPDLITGSTLGDHQIWRWNGQSYRLAQTIKSGIAINYPTKSIEDASKEYNENQ